MSFEQVESATRDKEPWITHKVLSEIREERERQDEEWGGPKHDDTHDALDWHEFIEYQCDRFYRSCSSSTSERPDRSRLVKVAALAIAALESIDRKAAAVQGGE